MASVTGRAYRTPGGGGALGERSSRGTPAGASGVGAPGELAPGLRPSDAPAAAQRRVRLGVRGGVLLDAGAVAQRGVRAPGDAPERLVVQVAVSGAEQHARTVTRSDEGVPRARRAVHEVPGPQ